MTPQLIARRLPDPDADVVELIERRAFDGALRVLMKRHGTSIYRFCCETLHDDMLAEDVLQQVFIEADRDLGRFERRSTLRAWLFGIARHRVLDFAKQRRRARAREDAVAAAYDDAGPPPCALLDDARLQAALIACLRELDDDVRTALLLRYQQGFTFDEMAGVCGEKSSTLHARVTRALPDLRARIERRIGGRASPTGSAADGRRGSIAGRASPTGSAADGRRGSIAGRASPTGSAADGRRGSIAGSLRRGRK